MKSFAAGIIIFSALNTCIICSMEPPPKRTRSTSLKMLFDAINEGNDGPIREYIEGGGDVQLSDEHGVRLIHVAAENGNLSILNYLIDCGADVLARDEWAKQPIHYATAKGHVPILERLKEHNPSVCLVYAHDGEPPISVAAKTGHLDALEWLFANGCDGETVVLFKRDPIIIASQQGHLEIVKSLIKHEANIHAAYRGKSAIHYAAEGGYISIIKYLIACKETLLVDCDRDRNQPVHLAARTGQLGTLKWLLKHRADLEATGHFGKKPIDHAAEGGQVETLRYLLEQKADVNDDYAGWYPIIWAARGGSPDVIKCLIEHSANIHAARSDGMQAIHEAAAHGYADALETLIEHGADFRAQNSERSESDPLFWAGHRGHANALDVLAAHGVDINVQSERIASTVRSSVNHIESFKWFIVHGAPIPNEYGHYTALQSALSKDTLSSPASSSVYLPGRKKFEPTIAEFFTMAAGQGNHRLVIDILINHKGTLNEHDFEIAFVGAMIAEHTHIMNLLIPYLTKQMLNRALITSTRKRKLGMISYLLHLGAPIHDSQNEIGILLDRHHRYHTLSDEEIAAYIHIDNSLRMHHHLTSLPEININNITRSTPSLTYLSIVPREVLNTIAAYATSGNLMSE